MEHKHFKCFRCKLHNNFYLPIYFKGKKCKRCHIFNYFNYFKKKNNHINNQYISERNRFLQQPKIQSHRVTNNNINNRNRIGILSNESDLQFRNVNFDFNDNIFGINHNFLNNEHSIHNRRENLFFDDPPFMSSINSNNFSFNNNQSIFSNSRIFNDIYNDYSINDASESNYSYHNYNPISWLKKSKATNDIIKKYEKCTICLEKLDGEIHITKCGHVFHYECIEKSINLNGLDCPICRRNLKTGQEKEVHNRNLYSNFETNNIIRSYSNSNYNNHSFNIGSNNNNRIERSENNSSYLNNFYLFMIFIIVINILGYLLDNKSKF